ncbi:hypothetical protein V2J94_42675 [Streptomyces sp. DSM 41524]|uniref:MvdD-like pre-ATP grasp domain-containing protein n=1 Tax=Streptomyces asiaticus subsp. ignotus TaxID=3098222 RepID=A0ABU7QAP5_9ACTN|nr:hypothetical protein [Streptomyces sp. DSM 41524]
MPTILVIAARDDWPTDRVVNVLTNRGVRVFRMDTADFPQRAILAGRIDTRRGWSGRLANSHRAVELSDIEAVYFRAPHQFRLVDGMSEAERRFAAAQARAGFGGVISALDARWVNHPAAMTRAEYKPIQLAAARECGLTIPATLVTNDPDAVRAFAEDTPGPIICKGSLQNDLGQAGATQPKSRSESG